MFLKRRWQRPFTIIAAVLGFTAMLAYTICSDSCQYLAGDLFGADLKWLGMAFMAAMGLLAFFRVNGLVRLSLAGALGGETFLLGFQFREGVFCPFCLAFALILAAAFVVNHEQCRRTPGWLYAAGEINIMKKSFPLLAFAVLGFLVFAAGFSGSAAPAYAEPPLPAYGRGADEVRIYSDYFCEPCRLMEPKIEALIEKIARSGKARVLFVDTPMHRETQLYGKYFLYTALGKDFDAALNVRRILFAAGARAIRTDTELVDYIERHGIPVMTFDVSSTTKAWNDLIRKDRVNSTPTCVIVQASGEKQVIKGNIDIPPALEKYSASLK